jgi:cobalt-zinc-cadmium efflux system outer membrane protein
VDVAPEARAAEARVTARQSALQQAGAWPNPEITLGGDDKLGKDDGSGGIDLTLLMFAQPLPLSGRLGKQKAVADAALVAARAERKYVHLILERGAATRFHELQLATARLELAEQRLLLADEWQETGRRREQAGELSTLERLRLDIIREAAQQILDRAEGEYNEALSAFRSYLELPPGTIPELVLLEPFGPVPALKALQTMSAHPALLAARSRVEAARFQVKLQRAGWLSDPMVQVFRERDVLSDRRQDVFGVLVSVPLPLWDRKSGAVGEAQSQVTQAQSSLRVIERDLSSGLQKSHLHLTHLVKQGEHYRSHVFEPARVVFDLTRRLYAAGEVEILSLIDGNDTYFDTQTRYLELLQEAWLEAAELRLAAGQALVSP